MNLQKRIISVIYKTLGVNAFRNRNRGRYSKQFHPAIFDAIMIAYSRHINDNNILNTINEKVHIELIDDVEFKNVTSRHTTNTENIF